MTIKSFVMLAAIGALGAFSVGCSDPCGEIKDCCVAQAEAIEGADASACDIYDEADSDACDAAIDVAKGYEYPEGVDIPPECEF